MNKHTSPHTRVESPVWTGSVMLPVPAVVVVILVVLLTVGAVAGGMPLETVVTTVSVGGLLAVEILRRTIVAVTPASRIR